MATIINLSVNGNSINLNTTEDSKRAWTEEHKIRLRPGMYIGKLGDVRSPDDGIYVLLKEVLTIV